MLDQSPIGQFDLVCEMPRLQSTYRARPTPCYDQPFLRSRQPSALMVKVTANLQVIDIKRCRMCRQLSLDHLCLTVHWLPHTEAHLCSNLHLHALLSRVQELESQQERARSQTLIREALSSFVWLVCDDSRSGPSAKGNVVSVIDAKEPNRCLQRFSVGGDDAHILCIASLPG